MLNNYFSNHMNFSMAEPSWLGIVCGQRMMMMMMMMMKMIGILITEFLPYVVSLLKEMYFCQMEHNLRI